MTTEPRTAESLRDARVVIAGVSDALDVADMRGQTDWEPNLERADAALDHLRTWAGSLVRDAERLEAFKTEDDLEIMISFLEQEEGRLLSELGPRLRQARRMLKRAIAPRQYKTTLSRQFDRFEDIVIGHEEALRDLRWELMRIGADRYRDDSGPTFDNPADLQRYLDGLKG
jgi:hypothetical protein